MDYTKSNMNKITESVLLFKNSFVSTRITAQRLYSTYSKLEKEFHLHGCRILELGAGRGGVIQLFDESNDVIGIDKYLGAFEQGTWKAIKTITRKLLFDEFMRRQLRKMNGDRLFTNRKVLNMDATDLKFEENSFDFIYSRFFLEHIEPIEKIATETFRMLRPGGTTYHVFALYTALDGAHTLDWRKFEPWQHLYGTVPSNAYVNKYRLSHYTKAFAAVYGSENVEIRLKRDAKAIPLLTPDLKEKLSGFADDELLVGSPEIIARKPGIK